AIESEEEARQAVASLIAGPDDRRRQASSSEIVPDEAMPMARRLLTMLLHDDAAGPLVQALVDDPPTESQMSVELAVAGTIIVGVLITWLQTKIDVRVVRKEGRTDFEFGLHKDATDKSMINDVIQSVGSLLNPIAK